MMLCSCMTMALLMMIFNHATLVLMMINTPSVTTIALGLFLQMENSEFVFVLHLMIIFLGITNDLSRYLQRKDYNIVRVLGLIRITLEKVSDVREHGWEELFEEINESCVGHCIVFPNMEDTLTIWVT